MQITRYQIKSPLLRPWVNFIWEMKLPDQAVASKLLPTADIDLLINRGAPMVYAAGERRIAAPPVHINGLGKTHCFLYQCGSIDITGISFAPFGLYPFVKLPMKQLRGTVADLFGLTGSLAQKFLQVGAGGSDAAVEIEDILLAHLTADSATAQACGLLGRFLEMDAPGVLDFCAQNSVTVKTFERLCLRYTGYPPAVLRGLLRFQAAGNQLVHQRGMALAEIAYRNHYADQAHFTRTFKALSGEPPRMFLRKGESVKERAAYLYR